MTELASGVPTANVHNVPESLPAAPLAVFPETHTYTWNGREVPGVTTVLARCGIIDTTYLKEEAAWRGSVIHRVCELDDLGTIGEYYIDPQALPYLEAWRKFKLETGFVPEEVELPRYNERYGFAGTPDRFGRIGKKRALPDIKSGQKQRWHRLQSAAYCHFYDDPWSILRFAVHLGSDGGYSCESFPLSELRDDFDLYLAALRIFRFKEGGK